MIEKLGFIDANIQVDFDDVDDLYIDPVVYKNREYSVVEYHLATVMDRKYTRVFSVSIEMLESLIEEVLDGEYIAKQQLGMAYEHHERYKDTRYMIPIIEKATNREWVEIKKKLELE